MSLTSSGAASAPLSKVRVVDHDVVIIGGGLAGLCAAAKLGADEFDYLVIERGAGVGGTWWHNRYPGVGVDVISVVYSFSFFRNPEWSRTYARGAELKNYAQRLADEYGMNDRIRLNSEVARAVYDADTCTWTTILTTGEQISSRYLIGAWGTLTNPKTPEIAGLDDFRGRVIHTAEWPHDADLKGDKVAVIGTGASAVQVVPAIAPVVERLSVFQRTATWVVPRLDFPVPRAVRALFRYVPMAERATRYLCYVLTDVVLLYAFIRPKAVWPLLRLLTAVNRLFLRLSVHDPRVRAALTPDYEFGCKRPTMHNSYLRTYNRTNVELVTAPIERITAEGIATADGQHYRVDTLVLGTGFRLWEPGGTPPVAIYGAAGQELGEQWAQGHYGSYEGIAVPDYPNMFFASWAPYGYTSSTYLLMVETNVRKIQRILRAAREQGAGEVAVDNGAYDRWTARMRNLGRRTAAFQPHCDRARAYYIDRHGDASFLRPTFPYSMWAASRHPALLKDFDFRPPTAAPLTASESEPVKL